MEIELPIVAGLLTSIIHVITGPDHLAAVLPFAIESKKKAWKVGLFWGIGHLLGMISIGVLFLLFRNLIPVESISEHSEKLVGIVLIGIGVWSFVRIFRRKKHHKHLHVHAEHHPVIHSHEHRHEHHDPHTHTHKKTLKQDYFTSLSIGVLHGLAGIAHFLLFFPVLGFETAWDSTLYIIGFAGGTLFAMSAFGFVIGNLSSYPSFNHNETFFNGIRLSAGLIAFIVGFYWLFAN